MNRKKVVSIYLVAMLIFSMATMLSTKTSADPAVDVFVVPAAVEYISSTYCEKNETEFTIKVNITGVTGLYGYDLMLGFDNTILRSPDTADRWWIGPGGVCPTGSGQVDGTDLTNDTHIIVSIAFVEGMGAPAFTGSGTLLWINFTIIYCPPQLTAPPDYNWANCTLDLIAAECKLYNQLTIEIPIDTLTDGSFAHGTMSTIPGEPTASFTAPDKITVCSYALCTDTSDAGSGAVIVTRDWKLINGTGTAIWTTSNNETTRTFHCLSVGTVTVNLTVTNDVPKSDSASKEIDQYEVAGAFIDVFTSDNRFCGQTTTVIGIGPDAPCDALSPDVNVTIFANVTWNKAPINHALVAFEVIWEWGIDWQSEYSQMNPELINETFLLRTGETNKDGIAQIWFRVPNPCDEPMFGKWLIIAKVKIQDETVMDTMRFHVGYLITLEDWPYVDQEAYTRCCSDITVSIPVKNIGYMTKNVKLVVVAYDDCDVPIGQYVYSAAIPGGQYCNPKQLVYVIIEAIHVPQWAYVGYGKVYVSAFTDLPRDCGIPYCPEKVTEEFGILYAPCGP